ncbi:MAG TPA: ATP-binding cassette domain-containing protein, partial [Reyranella sp.]|nr:ATP-binding cassette domain-containing protein [Reyranella sp.]
MASRQAVLGMERASFFYGSARVFGGVSFLLDGARTALVGENGAGKSTLLKCLTGELELNGGNVIRSRGLRVGSVPQDVPSGLADRPVRDVLHDALVKVGLGDDDWRIDVLLDEIGVEQEILDKPFGTLSGG